VFSQTLWARNPLFLTRLGLVFPNARRETAAFGDDLLVFQTGRDSLLRRRALLRCPLAPFSPPFGFGDVPFRKKPTLTVCSQARGEHSSCPCPLLGEVAAV